MKITKAERKFFVGQLMDWYREENNRSLPWKQEKDPYRVWLSEIILQQTRAEQGIPYYLKFTEQYPTLRDLAEAPDEKIFRLWQGLGYYNRCRNLLATARYVYQDLQGDFPDNLEGLLKLKGVGAYTAAAISSFSFGLPHAVVDGNVTRLLSRFFGIEVPINSTQGKQLFQVLAQELLGEEDSALYNQAIMDHGALICKPAAPLCTSCRFQRKCQAFQKGLIRELPVKVRKAQIKKRFFHYLILTSGKSIWIRKRTGKDIWASLYEPLLFETNGPMDKSSLINHPEWNHSWDETLIHYEGLSSQKLTHQIIEARFYSLKLKNKVSIPETDGIWVPVTELKNYAFPRTLVSFLEKKFYF